MIAAAGCALLATNLLPDGRVAGWWAHELHLELAGLRVREALGPLVTEASMTLFFLGVGLEIRHERAFGSLRDWRAAVLPVGCAIGGMVCPALVYLAVAGGGSSSAGWGIPTATDVALAVTILAFVAPGLPQPARVFLLTLAVADDLGGIVIICVWYSQGARWGPALAAVVVVVAGVIAVGQGWLRLSSAALVIVPAWLLLRSSGIQPAIIGAVFGLLVPVERAMARIAVREQAEGLLERLRPIVGWVVLPVFALVSGTVALGADRLNWRVASAVVLALVLGKPVGILVSAGLLERLGLGRRPEGTTKGEMRGLAALAGLGFTVALFITETSFDGSHLRDSAKVGVLIGGWVAVGASAALFMVARRRVPAQRRAEDVVGA